ncbi:PREDICTED: uncharacterized protein LOC108773624 [Cyphomyrmex costatus]|nr:PREDICTED: uncharacterized protein LOC108773624 [Cyphomyrmex costatus]
MNVTYKQREILLTYMESHRELLQGRLSSKSESRRTMKDMWDDLANILNSSAEGPKKNSEEWRKSWNDWRMNVLKKETKRRNHSRGTGGGSPMKVNFTDIEEKLLELLTPEAAGIENVPQGGIPLKKPRNEQSFMKDSHRHLQSTSVWELENTSVETQPFQDIQSDELQFIGDYEPVFNEGVYTLSSADKNKHSSIIETTNCSSDNEADKENINAGKSNKLLAKKRKIISPVPVPSHTTSSSKSLTGMSTQMLKVQEEKLLLKQQELQTKRNMLATQ